ncbi:6857_t:CDS:10 [Diversispora eburnea]|uniref:6857_t:CDS:1 n=1 Tax=Diversispora eburnea TaxID=1213867 RepID=A0A9N8YMT6_9GLOM|nr:6857_t:CDS:10 [Diversispora eburnea]
MSTLSSIFSSQNFSSKAIIIPEDGTILSYLELFDQIRLFQRRIIDLCDLQVQDVISIILPNSLEFIISFLATTLLRNIAAPLNPNYTENEFKFYFDDSKSKVVVVPSGWSQQNKAAIKASKKFNMVIIEIKWDHLRKEIKLEIPKQKVNPNDVALLLHTSGTTGRPKGVPLTHKNITTTMKNIIKTYQLNSNDCTLLVMPLFHVHGLIGGTLSTLLSGGIVVIPEKFSAKKFWNDFLDYNCTWYTAVPTIHQILLLHPFPSQGVPKLRFIRSCSSSLAPSTLFKLEQIFHVPVLEAYAMTEASHQMTSNPLPPLKHKPGSVGIPQGVQITILDENGKPTKEGEVCIKGENVTLGYLNNPSANASSFTSDGWFRTGDQGKFDNEGYLFLTGRIKELINRGGEKISPLEIDSVLLSHPIISEAVSFAVPDKIYGQEVHAAIKILSLIAEERLLDQEIEEQKRKRQTVETRNRVLNEISVKDHISETVEQYKKALPQLNQEIQDMKEQIAREKEILNEFDIINKTLSEKLELSNEHISHDPRFENLHEKFQKVQEIFDELNEELFKFIEHNFENKTMVDDNNEQRTSSLKTILEDLMNRAFSDAPYIRVDIDRVWKPYVGTLIRAGIAQRHPNDANLIKLVEFHK